MQHKLLHSLESLLASHFLRLKKKKRPKVGFGFEGLSKLPENRDYLPHFRKRKLKKRPPGSRFYLDCFFSRSRFRDSIQKFKNSTNWPLNPFVSTVTRYLQCTALAIPCCFQCFSFIDVNQWEIFRYF